MTPTLQPGERITVMPGDKYRLGEIILFHWGKNLILHRVVAKFFGRMRTKGDASYGLDFPVAAQEILGKAVFLERDGRIYDLDSLRSRWLGLIYSWAIFLASPLLPYLPDAVRRWARKKPRLIFP